MKTKLKLLILTNSFIVIAINLFAPFYAVYIAKLTESNYHIGTIWSAFVVLAALFTFILSRFENNKQYADHFLIASFISRSIGWYLYTVATNIYHIYFIQVFLALGEALGTPSYNLLFTNFLQKGKIAYDWGVNSSITFLTIGVASFVSGFIIEWYGFNVLFYIMILLSFIAMILGLKFKNEFSS
jgi:hypothetical protein